MWPRPCVHIHHTPRGPEQVDVELPDCTQRLGESQGSRFDRPHPGTGKELFGLSERTLYRRLKAIGLARDGFRIVDASHELWGEERSRGMPLCLNRFLEQFSEPCTGRPPDSCDARRISGTTALLVPISPPYKILKTVL